MIPRGWFGRTMIMVGLGLAAAAGTASFAAPTVKGDAAAWNEVLAAFRKLYGLPGYRMKISVTDGTVGLAEFAPPNFHWKVQPKMGPVAEFFSVGSQSAMRYAGPQMPGGGMCRKGASMQKPFKDPADFQGEITVTRQQDTAIDGTPVRAYAYETIQSGIRSTGVIYVGTQNGLPRRGVDTYSGDNGPMTATLDYYDYGAKITIALPNC